MKNKSILIAILLIVFSNAKAQKGSFNTSITFNSVSRDLSCFVPTTYDSTKLYKLMICLHGAGDNSNNYRNALINSLSWQNTFPNTIFICPDGGSDQSKDFYQPAGDEGIIKAGLDFAVKKFSIDTTQIILQGFSLGGRSALKYGLDHTAQFKGLLLNTPAIQGLADLENKPGSSLQFEYGNAKALPVFVTVGETDYAYLYTIQKLITTLKINNAPIIYIPVPGLGHNIPNNTITGKSNLFFNKQIIQPFDADLFELQTAKYFCGTAIGPDCLVRNGGDSIIRSMKVTITDGAFSKFQIWNGVLLPNEHVKIPISLALPKGGKYKLAFKVSQVNGGTTDSDTTNNFMSDEIEILSQKKLPSIDEGFESVEPDWTIQETGSIFGWYMDTDVKKSGKSSFGTFNTILLFNTLGYRESFSSPFIDISALTHKELSFDVAFNYHKYTMPYFTKDTYFSDTLEVMISTDCGVTYESLYKKGGKELATAPSPILNPLSVANCFFTPKSDQWRKEGIDLSKYSTVNNAIIKFVCISGLGGSMNIDNINAGSFLLTMDPVKESKSFKLYPNPATKLINIEFPLSENTEINILDQSGRSVISRTEGNSMGSVISIETLERGIYTVEILSGSDRLYKKLMVN